MALEIKNSGCNLEIGGTCFVVYPDSPEYLEKLEHFSKGAQEKARLFSGATDGIAEKTRDVCTFCLTAIDELLGPGAADSIFDGKTVGMMTLLEVLTYIKTESGRYLQTSGQRLQQLSGNRAQRRQKTKK
ncbi:MAG: hypothetical protein ACLRH1_11675 [Acutalibacteraceae bacterium]